MFVTLSSAWGNAFGNVITVRDQVWKFMTCLQIVIRPVDGDQLQRVQQAAFQQHLTKVYADNGDHWDECALDSEVVHGTHPGSSIPLSNKY